MLNPIGDVILCPYCFERMGVKDAGTWLLSPGCGHVTVPNHRSRGQFARVAEAKAFAGS